MIGDMVRRFDEEKYRDIPFAARETGLASIADCGADCGLPAGGRPVSKCVATSVFYGLARTRAAVDVVSLALLGTEDMQRALSDASTATPPLISAFELTACQTPGRLS